MSSQPPGDDRPMYNPQPDPGAPFPPGPEYGPQYGTPPPPPGYGPQYGSPPPPPGYGPQYAPGYGPQYAPGYGPQYGGPGSAPVPLPPGRRPIPADPMPLEPVVYQHLLRGPRYRWWKPLLCLLLLIPMVFGLISAATIVVVVAGLITGAPDLVTYTTQTISDVANLGPVGFVYTNLSLIVLIPAAMLSVWAVHGVRPRFLTSVRGGIRWGWLARCAAVIAPLWIAFTALGFLLDPSSSSARPAHWVALLVIVVLMTPFQAAGEEYLFRGWVLQNVGAWFARPMLGLVASLVVSAVAFSAAHTSPDPFIVGTLACLAITAGIATWRTGGLEAAIVIHAVNNVLSFFVVILFGGWQEAFVTSTSTAPPSTLIAAILVDAIALALIFWLARRTGISNRYAPVASREPVPVNG